MYEETAWTIVEKIIRPVHFGCGVNLIAKGFLTSISLLVWPLHFGIIELKAF